MHGVLDLGDDAAGVEAQGANREANAHHACRAQVSAAKGDRVSPVVIVVPPVAQQQDEMETADCNAEDTTSATSARRTRRLRRPPTCGVVE